MQSTCACFHETTRGIKQFHIHGMDLEFLKKTARIHYQEKETNCKNKLLTHMKARIKKKCRIQRERGSERDLSVRDLVGGSASASMAILLRIGRHRDRGGEGVRMGF